MLCEGVKSKFIIWNKQRPTQLKNNLGRIWRIYKIPIFFFNWIIPKMSANIMSLVHLLGEMERKVKMDNLRNVKYLLYSVLTAFMYVGGTMLFLEQRILWRLQWFAICLSLGFWGRISFFINIFNLTLKNTFYRLFGSRSPYDEI